MQSESSASKPVVYIFHGDDSFTIHAHIQTMIAQMGDASLAELNITRLDGGQAVDEALYSSTNALPFLAERRLVILTNPFTRMNTDAARKRFLALLDGLPESTALVLVVQDTFERKSWKRMTDAHFVRRWVKAVGPRAMYVLCQLPSQGEMPNWIRKEVRQAKGQIQPAAAKALADHVGNDTQVASLEIDKLLTFVDFQRAIEVQDVEELTAQRGQADVFGMVDAMAMGNTRQALHVLHQLLEAQEPLGLFGMITRQFRQLIQAREIMDEGRGGQVAAEMRLLPFVADKLAEQASRFDMTQLEDIYHRLLRLDEALKTSQMPADVSLDTFLVELGEQP